MALLRSRLRACLVLVVVAFALTGVASAESGETALPDRLIAKRYDWHFQHARLEVAEQELRQLGQPRPGGTTVKFNDPTTVLNELRPILTDDYKGYRNAANRLAEEARARRDHSRKDWEEVYRQRVAFRQFTDRQQAAYGFDFDSGTQAGFTFTLLDVGAFLWAVVIFFVAWRMGRQVRRVSRRRAGRAAAAVVLLALSAATGCSGANGRDDRSWEAREEAKLDIETRDAATRVAQLDSAADEKWKATVNGWAALIGSPGQAVEAIFRDGENEVRKSLREAAINARLADRLSTEAASQKTQLASDRTRLDSLTAGAKWRSAAFAGVRVAVAALLFALALAPFRQARRKESALVATDARKCPRCFSTKLVVEKYAPPPTESEAAPSRYRKPGAKSKQTVAESKADETPKETGYVECKACSFRFLRSYQKVRRLCFPVVGVPNSGKTHMLATGYDRVRKRTAPTIAVVQPAPSLGDQRFEQYIDLILNMKQMAGNTVHDVRNPPDPVMMHIRDADPDGPSTALVNLFDYSGELVNQAIDKDRLKKQAVLMDGFMFFLDPTQLYGDGANVTLDRQLAALNEFMADMREARGIPVGQEIPVPVAVCIPKFDLLLTDNPIQGQAIPFIRRLLTELSPPPKRTTLGTIRKRSEVVEEMLELMFRGVNIRELVESYFGSQVMFFPVTSVSLFENELGVRDLSKRTIAPFGVAEPFLWLLHMHGYEMFA